MPHPYTHFLKCNRQLTIVGYLIKKKVWKMYPLHLWLLWANNLIPLWRKQRWVCAKVWVPVAELTPPQPHRVCSTTKAQILTTAIVMTTSHHWSPSTRSPTHANCSHKPLGCDHSAMGTESIFTIRAHAHTLSLSDTHQHTLEQKR